MKLIDKFHRASPLILLLFMLSFAAVFAIYKILFLERPAPAPHVQYPSVRINKSFVPDNEPYTAENASKLISKIDTKLPVVFLTMDDGKYKDERAIDFIYKRNWPVTLFLADEYTKDNYNYFRKMIKNGATVQNHTVSHNYMTGLSSKEQQVEICEASHKIETAYDQRPRLFRPPGGFNDLNMRVTAKKCGIDAVIMWSAKVDGGQVQFQRNNKLEPGDIVLMHFRPKIMEDLKAFEKEIVKQNLYVARLEDWVRVKKL